MRSKLTATVMLFTTAIIWGFAFVAQVLGSDHVEPFTFNGIRFMLGAASLIPVYCIFEKENGLTPLERKQRHKHTALGAVCGGLCLFTASALQQFGAAMTRDPGKAGFITGLYTVLTPVFYFLIFRKKSGWNIWLGCVLATVGLYLLCLRPGEAFSFGMGELVILIGAFFWAGHILIVDQFIDRVSPLRFSSWQFFVSGALGLIAGVIFEDITWSVELQVGHPLLRYPVGGRGLYPPGPGPKTLRPHLRRHHLLHRVGLRGHRRDPLEPRHPRASPRGSGDLAHRICGVPHYLRGNRLVAVELHQKEAGVKP